MKILFVVPYVPNLIRVRPYQFLRHVAARGHTVTLATLWSSEAERRDLDALTALGVRTVGALHGRNRALWNCAWALPTRTPLQAAYCLSPELAALLDAELTMMPDAVHVEHLRGSPALLHMRRAINALPAQRRPRLIWDSVDCISLLFEQAARASEQRRARWMARFEVGRTRRHEGQLVHQADQTIVTAEGDAAALRTLAEAVQPGRVPHVSVVPNGVDSTTFRTDTAVERAPARIVFSGKMSYHANATAATHLARRIMPFVWAERPDAELWIVGKDPGPEISALANLGATQRVVVTGAVPSMALPLQQATVAAAPIAYGAGVQNKVLEAMACGTPVVASRQAASALTAEPGRDLLVAESPEDFARSILALLRDPLGRESVGKSGRAYVERCHSWEASAALLEAIYAKATDGPA